MPITINGNGPITGLTSIASPTTINGLTIPTTGFGKVLQVVNNYSSTDVTTSSLTAADLISASITLSNNSSKVIVLHWAYAVCSPGASNAIGTFGLLRDATTIGESWSFGNGTAVAAYCTVPLIYIDSPSSTSSITYKIQYSKGSTNTTSVTVYQNQLALLEVGP